MKRLASFLGVLCAATTLAAAEAEPLSRSYRVQLIWGTNYEKPPEARFKPVSDELHRALSAVVKWKHYWQVASQRATVRPGKPCRLTLSKDCLVEIEFVSATVREVRLFGKGKLVRKSRRDINNPELTLLGGDIEKGGGWFVAIDDVEPQRAEAVRR